MSTFKCEGTLGPYSDITTVAKWEGGQKTEFHSLDNTFSIVAKNFDVSKGEVMGESFLKDPSIQHAHVTLKRERSSSPTLEKTYCFRIDLSKVAKINIEADSIKAIGSKGESLSLSRLDVNLRNNSEVIRQKRSHFSGPYGFEEGQGSVIESRVSLGEASAQRRSKISSILGFNTVSNPQVSTDETQAAESVMKEMQEELTKHLKSSFKTKKEEESFGFNFSGDFKTKKDEEKFRYDLLTGLYAFDPQKAEELKGGEINTILLEQFGWKKEEEAKEYYNIVNSFMLPITILKKNFLNIVLCDDIEAYDGFVDIINSKNSNNELPLPFPELDFVIDILTTYCMHIKTGLQTLEQIQEKKIFKKIMEVEKWKEEFGKRLKAVNEKKFKEASNVEKEKKCVIS